MGKNKLDSFGDRMKDYERAESGRRVIPLLPILVRLDGRGFSKFTKGLERPYDTRLSQIMIEVTKALVKETNAVIGYTQSDEISLVLYSDNIKSQVYFNGKMQKMVSSIAAITTIEFYKQLCKLIPEKAKASPTFDCRIWNVPTKIEAVNAILWREKDATKNSISSAAYHAVGHTATLNKSSDMKKDILLAEGINWNDYPDFFKRGVFIQRSIHTSKPTEQELANLPEKHNARLFPNEPIVRTTIDQIPMPPFTSVINRQEVIFDGAAPKTMKIRSGFVHGEI